MSSEDRDQCSGLLTQGLTDHPLQSWGGSEPGRDSEGQQRLPRGAGGDQDEAL